MSPVRYELGCYIQEDDILRSHRRENLKCYMYTRTLLLELKIPPLLVSQIACHYTQATLHRSDSLSLTEGQPMAEVTETSGDRDEGSEIILK
jgi:hypothetical protein